HLDDFGAPVLEAGPEAMNCCFASKVGIPEHLGERHVGEWQTGLRTWEDKPAVWIGSTCLAQYGKCARRQWNNMFDARFHALGGHDPQRFIEINFTPIRKPNLAAA